MEFKIQLKDNRVEMLIEGEDYSIGEIVQHELLKDDRVAFAGVKPSHPLLKSLVINVLTKGDNPTDVIIEGCQKALKNADELLKAIEEKVSSLKSMEAPV